jgi:hypothetical protein
LIFCEPTHFAPLITANATEPRNQPDPRLLNGAPGVRFLNQVLLQTIAAKYDRLYLCCPQALHCQIATTLNTKLVITKLLQDKNREEIPRLIASQCHLGWIFVGRFLTKWEVPCSDRTQNPAVALALADSPFTGSST